jgi:hypothetical protein
MGGCGRMPRRGPHEALVCGGRDELPNLQWLAIERHKEKTRVEVKLCRAP